MGTPEVGWWWATGIHDPIQDSFDQAFSHLSGSPLRSLIPAGIGTLYRIPQGSPNRTMHAPVELLLQETQSSSQSSPRLIAPSILTARFFQVQIQRSASLTKRESARSWLSLVLSVV